MLQYKCNKREEIICCTLTVINETVVAIWRDGGSRKGGRTRGRKMHACSFSGGYKEEEEENRS